MNRTLAAGLGGLLVPILLTGCAPLPPPGPPEAPAAPTAEGRGGGWEPAPTITAPLQPQRDNGRRGLSVSRSSLLSGTGTRGAMGWPDRYQGDLGGAPYRPQY
ncbi:hypothetical protein NF552_02430 [Roseomonas mucosa]|nr:hypothetical protein NF552_02430 [Roseomonas mucosa]